jgi:hypothetical protein
LAPWSDIFPISVRFRRVRSRGLQAPFSLRYLGPPLLERSLLLRSPGPPSWSPFCSEGLAVIRILLCFLRGLRDSA